MNHIRMPNHNIQIFLQNVCVFRELDVRKCLTSSIALETRGKKIFTYRNE